MTLEKPMDKFLRTKGLGEFILGSSLERVLTVYGEPEGISQKSETSAGGCGHIAQYHRIQLWSNREGVIEKIFFDLKIYDHTNRVFPSWNLLVQEISACKRREFETAIGTVEWREMGNNVFWAEGEYEEMTLFGIFKPDRNSGNEVLSMVRVSSKSSPEQETGIAPRSLDEETGIAPRSLDEETGTGCAGMKPD